MAALAVAAGQVALAGALFWRVPGAWLVAIATLGLHLLALALFGLLLLAFEALPYEGGGPLPGSDFNALALAAIVVGGVGLVGLYALGIASARQRRPKRSPDRAVTEAPFPH